MDLKDKETRNKGADKKHNCETDIVERLLAVKSIIHGGM
jgi:hypothetical protein